MRLALSLALSLTLLAGCADEPLEEGGAHGSVPSRPDPAVLSPDHGRPFGATIRFRTLGATEGLPRYGIQDLWQDATGFVWVGTRDGLFRYDGVQFRAYGPVPFDSTSLAGAWVIGLAESGGALWVGTEGGRLSRYDPSTDGFARVPESQPPIDLWGNILDARRGGLWVGEIEGVSRFRPGQPLESYRSDLQDPDAFHGTHAWAMLEDDAGLWVGTQTGGLNRLDVATGRWSHYRHRPGDESSIPSDFVSALLRDRRGRLWVGTDEGLARLDPVTGTATRVAPLAGDIVRSLLEDPAGMLWVGTETGGLVRFDPDTDRSDRFVHDPVDPTSLRDGKVYALMLDQSGLVWVGTEGGVSTFPWTAPPFQGAADVNVVDYWALLRTRDGSLWVGGVGGLWRYAPDGRVTQIRQAAGDPAALSPNAVMSLWEEPEGTLLVGTYWNGSEPGALHRLDPATGRVLQRFRSDPDDPTSLPTTNPWALAEDREGRLWVLGGSSGCAGLMDRAAGTFTPYCPSGGGGGGTSYAAKDLAQTDDGTLWLPTWGQGLARLDPTSGRVEFLRHDPADPDSPAENFIASIHRDGSGALWLGTYGAGLTRFDPSTGVFRHYNTANSGLPHDVVVSIEGDADGALWLGTHRGLVRFFPGTERFESFGPEDGVEPVWFNQAVSSQAASGEILFGARDGIVHFNPADIGARRGDSPVVITSVSVDGEPVRPRPGGGLETAAPYARRARLGPGQRDVAFQFAVLDYAHGSTAPLRFRLDGYDEAWYPSGPARTATYTNLDPGRYTFRVEMAGSDGAWSAGASMSVAVVPLWYEAIWLRVLLLVAGVGAIAAGVRTRDGRRRIREERLEAEVAERTDALRREKETTEAQAEQLRELDRAKSRFFANVSHEFRTPLTLTIGPLEDLREGLAGPLSEEGRETADLALRSARRVLGLVNQVLDVAKLDAGRVRLRARAVGLGPFVERVAGAFVPLAERVGVALDVETVPVEAWVDEEALDAVLSNLLSNAFKFTPAGGTVRVRLSTATEEAGLGEAVLTVADTGPGIASADLDRVFDRFYQADTSTAGGARQPGTGIGLALARELSALHGGSVDVESTPGEGATFTVRIPLGRDHLAPDQIASAGPLTASLGSGTDAEPAWTLPLSDDDADAPPVSDPDDGLDRATLLIVDDHAGVRAYVRRHFEDDYRVLEAANGTEALKIARERLPDLVVSDVMMPELDGVGLCRALKADPVTDYVPVVLLTAKAGEEATVEGLGALADAYVTKPFNVRELAAQVAGLIEGRRRLRARWAGAPGGDGQATGTTDIPDVSDGDQGWLGGVRAAAEAGLADEAFGPDALAAAVGLSRSALYRRLAEAADVTPAALLREARLDRAKGLLVAREGSVSEVAYACGFRSVSSFSRAYRQRYDETPSAARRT